jgi:hypothetical protein
VRRRSFLAALAALPFAPKALKALAADHGPQGIKVNNARRVVVSDCLFTSGYSQVGAWAPVDVAVTVTASSGAVTTTYWARSR